jgi:hypothetical protein
MGDELPLHRRFLSLLEDRILFRMRWGPGERHRLGSLAWGRVLSLHPCIYCAYTRRDISYLLSISMSITLSQMSSQGAGCHCVGERTFVSVAVVDLLFSIATRSLPSPNSRPGNLKRCLYPPKTYVLPPLKPQPAYSVTQPDDLHLWVRDP